MLLLLRHLTFCYCVINGELQTGDEDIAKDTFVKHVNYACDTKDARSESAQVLRHLCNVH